MGWDAIIMGELIFENPAAVALWKRKRAAVMAARWPSILAPFDDDIGSDQGAVDDLLEELRQQGGGHEYFEVTERGRAVTFRAYLGEDDYRSITPKLVALLAAANASGATGRFEVRNAGAHTGGAVDLGDGRLRMRELGRTLSPEDELRVREVIAQAGQRDLKRRAKERAKTPAAVADPRVRRLQSLAKRTPAQEADLRDLLQIAMLKENRAGDSPANVRGAIKRVAARLKSRAKRAGKSPTSSNR